MKKWIAGLGASLLFASRAFALAVPAPALNANAWLLLDAKSDEIIASVNPDIRVQPASLTKIMTAYLVFQALREHRLSMDQRVTVSADVWKIAPDSSKMFLKPGDRVTVEQLLTGLLVDSGNDAAVALAEATDGSVSAFVAQMNQMAAKMGLKSTHFASPHGLPSPETYSTARDLSQLARNLIRDYPKLYQHFDTIRQYTYDHITQRNRNGLLWIDKSVDGLKTGHTQEAGYCLIASAVRPGASLDRRLISVVLGTPSSKARVQESETLLDWGFGNFDTVELFAKNQVVAKPRVWKGAEDQVPVGFTHNVYLTVERGEKPAGGAKVVTDGPLVAPIAARSQVASLSEQVGSRKVTLPLVALQPVAQAGFLGRTWDTVALWMHEKMG